LSAFLPPAWHVRFERYPKRLSDTRSHDTRKYRFPPLVTAFRRQRENKKPSGNPGFFMAKRRQADSFVVALQFRY
jgi:hypothetical protein